MLDFQIDPFVRMMDAKLAASEKAKVSRVEVYWHTVRYRTVALYAIASIAIVLSMVYLVFPEFSNTILRRLSAAAETPDNGVANPSSRQARFVNLDGKVQVKKVNSVQWMNADYQLTLDKGDLIQTDSEGVARIAFADGTTYTVKGDTLVTVEENIVEPDRATQVGVHMTSGQVDLQTGSWQMPGSTAEVSFENAVASARANSRMGVRADPATKEQEVTVDSGSAELSRGIEHVDIGQYERATIPSDGGSITKTEVLAPPELLEPLNLQPIILSDPKHDPVHFSWKAAATAKMYDFQASTTAMFSHISVERKTAATSVDIPGLDPGDYFWRVRAIDEKNNVSDASDSFKFTLVAQGKEQEMVLEVDDTQLQGSVVEVIGHTEPGATLIINGEQVADIKPDGHFRFFTQPMTRGSHTIAITGQNRRGGTATKRVDVVIP
ncbi:MAG TPA: FecR domain-containing protein [Candidatus Acidoferrales bacterium]|nr:FecR domain-containing protein [Candidatus Acidoferrales bacterium]